MEPFSFFDPFRVPNVLKTRMRVELTAFEHYKTLAPGVGAASVITGFRLELCRVKVNDPEAGRRPGLLAIRKGGIHFSIHFRPLS
jgi:hypothetical protein